MGLNRKYLANVGTCVCMSGFDPVETGDEADDTSDCQKIIYAPCTGDEERDITGKCRAKDDCAAECDGGTGTVS